MQRLSVLLLTACLAAGEAAGFGPAPELPPAVAIRGEGLIEGAGLVWPAGDAEGTVEVAAAIGALPELPAGPLPLAFLAAGWQPVAPEAGKPLALVVVGPGIEPDREVCRIESVRLTTDSIVVVIGRWSGPELPRKATPSPLRHAWLLHLPARPAGPGQVVLQQRWHGRDAATGCASQRGFASGTAVAFTVGAAGGRATRRLAPVEGWAPPREVVDEWLPAARPWTHSVQAPGILIGTGLLGWRHLDAEAVVAMAATQRDAKPEVVLAQGGRPEACVLVNGPVLNSGEYCTLRSALWTAPDTLRLTLTVWYDQGERGRNIPHQDTWLLPIHPRLMGAAPPGPPRLRLQLDWESRFRDPASGWYRMEPGVPRRVPAGAVTDLTAPAAAPAAGPAANDF